MRKHMLPAALLGAMLALLGAGAAVAKLKVERLGDLYIADDGGISPSALPRHGYAPIGARISGRIGTVDGSHPPALRTVELDVERTIRIDADGLAACRPGKLEARSTSAAKRACPGAIVGSGKAEVEVAFPESRPFSARGPLVLFNGGAHGRTTVVLLHAYVSVPAPTAVVVRATISRVRAGRYGLRIRAAIPKIAGGAGSVTKFELRVERRFGRAGRRKSLLTATCPSGIWMTRGHAVFAGGLELGLTHSFPCTPLG